MKSPTVVPDTYKPVDFIRVRYRSRLQDTSRKLIAKAMSQRLPTLQ